MVRELSPDEVAARLAAGDGLDVVDIRKPEDYAEGHIPGADNVPLREIEDVVDDREWGDEVVVTCYTGKTSKPAARLVRAVTGADAASMAGGFAEWGGDVARPDADAATGDDGGDGVAVEPTSD